MATSVATGQDHESPVRRALIPARSLLAAATAVLLILLSCAPEPERPGALAQSGLANSASALGRDGASRGPRLGGTALRAGMFATPACGSRDRSPLRRKINGVSLD